MEIIIGILIVVGIFFLTRKKNSISITTYVDGKKRSQTTVKVSPRKKDLTFPRAVENSLDISYFYSSDNKFKFPRYKSSKGALVKIKDITDYKEFWSDFDSEEKQKFTFKDFEFHIESYIEFEIEEFWSFMKRLKISDLKPYQFIKNDIEGFESLVYELEEPDEEEPYVLQRTKLIENLYDNGMLSEYIFVNNQQKQKYHEGYFFSLKVPELKDLSKSLKLKTTLKKEELVKQLIVNIDLNDIDIASPLVKNNKFDEMIKHFSKKYISSISNQIDKWHPFYIQVVWDEVKGNLDDIQKLKETLDSLMIEKYWKKRIYLEKIYRDRTPHH